MADFPLIDQEKALDSLLADMPADSGAVVIFIVAAPDHGDSAAMLSVLSTVPPALAYKALVEVAGRYLRGETNEPLEARVQ